MNITPDAIVIVRVGSFSLNATLFFTWIVMATLVIAARLVTRRINPSAQPSRWQIVLEVLVEGMADQIRSASRQEPGRYLPFIGTLFLFIASSNLLAIVPGFEPPTGSLSTTAALAVSVFLAVPLFGIASDGLGGYLRHYADPTWLMIPFNVIGDLSRTIALAVRLYGNIMSETLVVGILLGLAPFFFPLVMRVLGLITGFVQAYIFAILAMVYIASAAAPRRRVPQTRTGGTADAAQQQQED